MALVHIIVVLTLTFTLGNSTPEPSSESSESSETYHHINDIQVQPHNMYRYLVQFLKTIYGKSSSIAIVAFDYRSTNDRQENKSSLLKSSGGHSQTHSSCDRHVDHQDDEQSIAEFKTSLGVLAQYVCDSQGQIIGVELENEDEAASRFKSSGDNDQCCSTVQRFFWNTTLTNVYGKKQTLLQLSNSGNRQFIRHGFCGRKGRCSGDCVQQYIHVCLYVYQPGHPNAPCQLFKVPGYCSCKNFGP